jgi:hypothetical protein
MPVTGVVYHQDGVLFVKREESPSNLISHGAGQAERNEHGLKGLLLKPQQAQFSSSKTQVPIKAIAQISMPDHVTH